MSETIRAKANQTPTHQLQSLRATATLKEALIARRRELQTAVRHHMRDGRERRTQERTDDLEHSEADTQDDLAMALLQMQSEALVHIDAALVRLEAGRYGRCADCERAIARQRLRALPFAVHCQTCEESREQAHRDARRLAEGHGSLVRFSQMA